MRLLRGGKSTTELFTNHTVSEQYGGGRGMRGGKKVEEGEISYN